MRPDQSQFLALTRTIHSLTRTDQPIQAKPKF